MRGTRPRTSRPIDTARLAGVARHVLGGVVVAACLLMPAGCRDGRSESGVVELPETSVLNMESSWAVITSSHLRLREQPEVDARIVTTLWRGNVLEIISKQNNLVEVEDEEDFWYQVRFDGLQGWVFGAYLNFYTSHDSAVAAGEQLRR